jgi:hypothetical protein
MLNWGERGRGRTKEMLPHYYYMIERKWTLRGKLKQKKRKRRK